MNVDATRGRVLLRVRHRVARQSLDDLTLLVRRAQSLLRALVEVEVLFRDDDVHVRHLAELAQLQRRKFHLRRAATTEHVHVGNRVLSEALGHVGRHLCLEHVLGVLGQDASHIQRHIANAQDGDLAGLQRPRARVIRVAVIPGHEVGSAVGLGQVHARNVERVITVRARRNDDRVVVVTQVVDRHVTADLDIAEQADIATLQDLVQRYDDLLDTRVIRSDAVAHETVGRGKTLKQVDIHLEPRLGQDVRRVNASGTSADNGDVERCQPISPSS